MASYKTKGASYMEENNKSKDVFEITSHISPHSFDWLKMIDKDIRHTYKDMIEEFKNYNFTTTNYLLETCKGYGKSYVSAVLVIMTIVNDEKAYIPIIKRFGVHHLTTTLREIKRLLIKAYEEHNVDISDFCWYDGNGDTKHYYINFEDKKRCEFLSFKNYNVIAGWGAQGGYHSPFAWIEEPKESISGENVDDDGMSADRMWAIVNTMSRSSPKDKHMCFLWTTNPWQTDSDNWVNNYLNVPEKNEKELIEKGSYWIDTKNEIIDTNCKIFVASAVGSRRALNGKYYNKPKLARELRSLDYKMFCKMIIGTDFSKTFIPFFNTQQFLEIDESYEFDCFKVIYDYSSNLEPTYRSVIGIKENKNGKVYHFLNCEKYHDVDYDLIQQACYFSKLDNELVNSFKNNEVLTVISSSVNFNKVLKQQYNNNKIKYKVKNKYHIKLDEKIDFVLRKLTEKEIKINYDTEYIAKEFFPISTILDIDKDTGKQYVKEWSKRNVLFNLILLIY